LSQTRYKSLEMSVEGQSVKKYAQKYRKWIATVQNPDPSENFPQKMVSLCSDIKFICWGYEMGNEKVGEVNPAYVEGEDTGGNLHYQVYFETTKQYTQSAMRQHLTDEDGNGIWTEWAYAPKSAQTYAVKADHTLVDGPWEWGGQSKQGERNDLKAAVEAMKKNNLTYDDLRKTGQHHGVCAKYKGYIKEIEMDICTEQLKEIEWPIKLSATFSDMSRPGEPDETKTWEMNKPDPKNKKRNWWVVAKADWGKTYWMNEKLGDFKVYAVPKDKTYRYETYDDQDLIIYDDRNAEFSEYADVLNTWKVRSQVCGKVRYTTKYWKRNHTRNIIVLNNHTIEEVGFTEEHVKAMHARFTVIDIRESKRVD